MSSVQTPPKQRSKSTVEYIEYDKYIDRQVQRTRRAVKMIDLAQAVLVLVIGLAGYLLTAALLEHWVVRGGLGGWGRLALFGVLVVLLGYYLVRYLWPLLSQSINPAYAAQAIEREHPTLKNSLLNFLLFRSHKREMPAVVFEALEEQAAHRLSQTSLEDSVDRSALVKLGYVLLAVVAAFALYASLSPKSSLTTAARVLMPWADIAAPSRVRIESIEPGDTQIVQGESLDISVQVFGLREGEVVELSYDTADGHRVDQRVAMQPANDAGKYVASLPPAGDPYSPSGIDQDLRYRITAGDGRSIDYQIHVVTAPTIRVRQVHFDFPEYTGYVDRTVENRGDIRAIEGTQVTIIGEANSDIAEAYVDLASDGRNDKRMESDGRTARATLPLRLESGRQSIKSTSYMLRYTSVEGLDNNEPPQHTIEILPDYPPEVELLEPKERSVDVRLNETVAIDLDARDPDFALRTVTIRLAKEDGTPVDDVVLLDKPHQGRFARTWDFTPADQELRVGEIVEYWAEVTDVRTPQANRSTSERKQFRIVGDPRDNAQQRQQNGEGQQGEGQEGEGEQGEGQQGEGGQRGERGEDQQGEGQQGEGGQNEQGQGQQQEQTGEGEQGQQQQGAGGQEQAGEQQQGQGDEGGQQQDGTAGQAGENAERQDGQNGAGDEDQQSRDGQQQQGEGGQAGENSDGAAGENTRPVANDGSDDGTAFEKIQRQLSEQERQNATRERRPGTADEGEAATERSDQQPGDETGDESGEPQDSQNQEAREAEGAEGEGSDAEPQSAGDDAGAETATDTPQSTGGEENETAPDAESQSTGGDEREAAGEPGAGQDTEAEGTPEAQRNQQQRDKTAQQQGDSQDEGGEPPAPGHSKTESDSQGEEGGDRSGGGEEGGGQQAPREGTGSAGQNQAADEGAGQSADQGPGETGQRGGDSRMADGKTGESGDEQGNGSESREGDGESQQQGQQQGEQTSGEQQQGQPTNQQSQDQNNRQQPPSGDQQASQQESQNNQGQQGDQQPGDQSASPSGQPGGNDGNSPDGPEGDFDTTLAEGDDANLEYTRKQTELVLDKLSDQLDNGEVDQEMLDELGWSKEDLRKFVDRWSKLRQNAQREGDPAAQQELDERLRSLGPSLGPRGGTTQRTQDDFRDLRQGYQDKVPLKYRDRLKAYTEGVSRSDQDE